MARDAVPTQSLICYDLRVKDEDVSFCEPAILKANPATRLEFISQRLGLALLTAGLLFLLLVRLGVVRSAGHLGFLVVVGIIWSANLFWWSWTRSTLRRAMPGGRPAGWRRWQLVGWDLYCLLAFSPFVLVLVGGRHAWDSLPVPLITWTLIWHMLMAGLGSAAAVLWVAGLAGRLVPRRPAPPPADPSAPPAEPRLSRREVLSRAIAVAPVVIAGGSVAAGYGQAGRFEVRRVALSLPRLPDRLRGLTITHLSDFHVGRLFRPEHLPRVVDAANALGSDLLVVTGDIIDHSNDFLPAARDAIARIEARLGRFLVLGNHDLMDSEEFARMYLASLEPNLLMDRWSLLEAGGESIQIAGVDWSRHEQPVGRDPGMIGRAERAMKGTDPERFTLALAHHPHAFEALADRGADLVLAGHTHGGQLMLTPQGSRFVLGAGNLMFRYIHGVYRRGDSALYVNAGVGNWFPVRFNAPAEMVQIQLV